MEDSSIYRSNRLLSALAIVVMTSKETPSAERTYRVVTYDATLGEYTKQDGVPEIVTGIRGLISAVRLLRGMGYPADRNAHGSDPAVLIERIDSSASCQ